MKREREREYEKEGVGGWLGGKQGVSSPSCNAE